MPNLKMQADAVARNINELLLQYPELEGDDQLRADVFEGETDLETVIQTLLNIELKDKERLAGIKQRQADLTDRKARFVRRSEMARALIFRLMEAADLKKLELSEATLSMRNGRMGVVLTATPEELLSEFRRVKVEADLTKIKSALEAGQIIPGASLNNGPPTLSIRTK